jgi:hypothetical protein
MARELVPLLLIFAGLALILMGPAWLGWVVLVGAVAVTVAADDRPEPK